MAENEGLNGRLEELQLLVDEEKSEERRLKDNVAAFGTEELGHPLQYFQVEGASYLVNGEPGNVLALVRPPGDGKSLTYIIAGCRNCGITIVFQPTLTLGGDQSSKLKGLSDKLQLNAFNLDDYKSQETWEPVLKTLQTLKDVPPSAMPRVFLIVSPQCMTNDKLPWRQLIMELAVARLVRLLVVDEFHVWWKQGVSFRTEFKKAGRRLIGEVMKKSPKTSIAMLTATCQLKDIALVEDICGVLVRRILWATPREMQKRSVKIDILCRSQYFAAAKKVIMEVLRKPDKKVIVYCEFKDDVEKIADAIRREAAETIDGCEIDCIEITGLDSAEQKGFSIDIFCENVTHPDEKKLVKLYRVLVATSGSASTGIDPPNVELVTRKGLPPSPTTLFQEMGRLQRGEASTECVYLYFVVINVDTFAGLLLRTETSSTATKEEKARNLVDHFKVLRMLVLDECCVMFALECMFGRPGSNETLPETCENMCPVCSGARNEQSAPFFVLPLQRTLAQIFLESATVNLKNDFVSKLKDASLKEGVWGVANDVQGVRTTINTYNVEMLALQLIAADIITCDFKVLKGKGKDGGDVTEVHVRALQNDDRTGFKFSDGGVFDAIPKKRDRQTTHDTTVVSP